MTHPPTSGQVRAAGYVRVSTQEQNEKGWNIGADRERIEATIAERGWARVEVFDDGGRQGDDHSRPGFARMLERLDDFDVLIIRDLDRFSRSLAIYAPAVEAIKLAKVRVEEFAGDSGTGTRPIDLQSEDGEAMAAMKAVFAQMEKAKIKRRVRQALGARAKAGLPVGGPPPYGYQRIDGELRLDPVEAPVVRRIYDLYESGMSDRAIGRKLDADGVPNRTGGFYNTATVRRVLTNPVYAGRLLVKGTIHKGQHEPMVDPDLWERFQAARTTRGPHTKGRPPRGNHLLVRGLLRCGRCGAAMTPRVNEDGVESYVCLTRSKHGRSACDQSSIRRTVVDGATLAHLAERVIDRDETRRRFEAQQGAELSRARAALTEAERDALGVNAEARLGRIRRGWQEEVIGDDEYRQQCQEVQAENDAALAAVEQARSRVQAVGAAGPMLDAEEAIFRRLAAFKAVVADGIERSPDLAAQRNMLTQVFERVILCSREHPWPRDFGTPEAEVYETLSTGPGRFIWPLVRREAWDTPARGPRRIPVEINASDSLESE